MAQRPTIKPPKALNPVRGGAPNITGAPGVPNAPNVSGAHVLDNLQAEISVEAAPLWNFVTNHARVIAAAVVALVLVIAGVAGWQWRVESAASASRVELGRILSRQDPAARLAELETFAASAPKSVALAVQMELAVAAVQTENWDKAAEAYSRAAELDKGGALGLAARLNRADVYLRQGKAAEAVQDLDALLPTLDEGLQPVLQQQIAEAAEAAGNRERAVKAYESLLSSLDSSVPGSDGEADYYRARIAAMQ